LLTALTLPDLPVSSVGAAQHPPIKEWLVPDRCLREISNYSLNKLTKVGEYLQLLIEMDVILPNESLRRISILVDTGAQANLVRTGLVPFHLTEHALNPVRLMAANSTILSGGNRTVMLTLGFNQVKQGHWMPKPLFFDTEFYTADIEMDAILVISLDEG
jgi:hypothetical protein